MTDEILEKGFSEDIEESALVSEGFYDEWSEKLSPFAQDVNSFNKAFTQEDLGEGQMMTLEESSRICSQNELRKNAGLAYNSVLDADLVWGKARVKEEKKVGFQLERGIQKAKNIQLGNELAYQVGKIALHGEKRFLQLEQLHNQVKGLRQTVQVTSKRLEADAGSLFSKEEEVDFTKIQVEE